MISVEANGGAINDLGQVVVVAALADGRTVVLVATPEDDES